MSKLELGWTISVPAAVISAALFLCNEHVFTHSSSYLSLYF